MNQLAKVFSYEQNQVRTVVKDNKPWFVAKDVCEILEISNHKDASSRLSSIMKDEVGIADSIGRMQNTTVISEAGVYKLVFTSRKPEADRFTDWLAIEVLPQIRTTGGYVADDDMFITTYLPFADETTKALFKSTLEVVKSQNQKIEIQRKEIEYKENVIIGLVDDIDLESKRQILNQVVRHKGADFRERWRMLYYHFEKKYHLDLSRKIESYNQKNKPKIKSNLEYIDKVLDMVPQLYELAAKLYEGDVKELANKLYAVC